MAGRIWVALLRIARCPRRRTARRAWLFVSRFGRLLVVLALVGGAALAQPHAGDERDEDDLHVEWLRGADIETLMQIDIVPVTTVEGVERQWVATPSAIHVISAADIRRAGHRSLPEALRLVPGMHVAQINSSQWAVSSRGFAGRFANKLLVLIDGRTVYDPLFSGTFWETQDVLLEDIDRIEVIRGPGATLWGANAVNGVVNVITRRADQTQGLFLSGGGGSYEQGFGSIRYGGRISDEAHFRVWGKYFNRARLRDAFGRSAEDDWDMLRGGFRIDANTDVDTALTLMGELYHTDRLGEAVRLPVPGQHLAFRRTVVDGRAFGGHFLARIEHEPRADERWSLNAYYDRSEQDGVGGFGFERDTFDIEFRHAFHTLEAHELIWGAGFRHSGDRITPTPFLSLEPRSRSLNTFSAFVQDTITLVPRTLFFMAGTKLEHNSFTGFEVQPGGRLWWTPDARQTVWAAISRPVRVPSRAAADVRLTAAFADPSLLAGGPPSGASVPLMIVGARGVRSERLIASELGYRIQPVDELSVDLATFYNDYDRVISLPPGGFGAFGNDAEAQSYGGEVTVRWRAAPNWRVEGAYSFIRVNVRGPGTVIDDPGGSTPRHMARLSSHLDVTEHLQLNTGVYFVDRAPAQGVGSHTRLDLGLTWRPRPDFELAAWGLNLLNRRHREFAEPLFLAAPVEIERSFYLQATLRF